MNFLRTIYLQILFVFLAFFAMVAVSYSYVSEIVQKQNFRYTETELNLAVASIQAAVARAESAIDDITFLAEKTVNDRRSKDDLVDILNE